MSFADNPRAVIGSNEAPDYAQRVTDQMREDYAEVSKTVESLLEEARAFPSEITDDETKGSCAALIKRFRDLTKRLDAFHAKEGEPHLRGKQAVDQFFFGLWDKCARRDKKNKPGAADILLARLNDYDQRKLAEEQARRRREAEEAARIAATAAAERLRLEREAEVARLAAERARAPAKVEEKAAIADRRAEEAAIAQAASDAAAAKAQETYISTLAKPADLMRSRDANTGTLSTMATEPYAEVVDRNKLDYAALAPFFSIDAIEKALRAWAKSHGHNKAMDGASIGKRPRSVVR